MVTLFFVFCIEIDPIPIPGCFIMDWNSQEDAGCYCSLASHERVSPFQQASQFLGLYVKFRFFLSYWRLGVLSDCFFHFLWHIIYLGPFAGAWLLLIRNRCHFGWVYQLNKPFFYSCLTTNAKVSWLRNSSLPSFLRNSLESSEYQLMRVWWPSFSCFIPCESKRI